MELTAVAQLRRMVLEHLSRYTWNDSLIDHVYDILQEVRDDTPRYRCCVYKERAILGERVKLAMGRVDTKDEDKSVIRVIDIACDECPVGGYEVSEACRGCLAHRC